jgi:hypothetical protein
LNTPSRSPRTCQTFLREPLRTALFSASYGQIGSAALSCRRRSRWVWSSLRWKSRVGQRYRKLPAWMTASCGAASIGGLRVRDVSIAVNPIDTFNIWHKEVNRGRDLNLNMAHRSTKSESTRLIYGAFCRTDPIAWSIAPSYCPLHGCPASRLPSAG